MIFIIIIIPSQPIVAESMINGTSRRDFYQRTRSENRYLHAKQADSDDLLYRRRQLLLLLLYSLALACTRLLYTILYFLFQVGKCTPRPRNFNVSRTALSGNQIEPGLIKPMMFFGKKSSRIHPCERNFSVTVLLYLFSHQL